MEKVQEIIDELEKDKNSGKKLKKHKKSIELNEKSYLKKIILEEMKKGKSIEPFELSINLGTSKELVEKIIKEINEEKKVKDLPKPKKEKKIRNSLKKQNEKLKKLLDSEDKETLKDFLIRITLFGLPINFAMTIVSKGFFTFNYYTWIGWGIAFWFCKKEVSPFLRGIIHK